MYHVVHNTRLNLAGQGVRRRHTSFSAVLSLSLCLSRNLFNLPLNRSNKFALSRSFNNDEKRRIIVRKGKQQIINYINYILTDNTRRSTDTSNVVHCVFIGTCIISFCNGAIIGSLPYQRLSGDVRQETKYQVIPQMSFAMLCGGNIRHLESKQIFQARNPPTFGWYQSEVKIEQMIDTNE